MAEEEEGDNEVTLFRPNFARMMFMQKAEEAGFMVAMEPDKWAKLFSLLQERSIGFFHAAPEAQKVIGTAHDKNKDMTLRMRADSNGAPPKPS
jgi:hypothetical protein